MTIYLYVKTHNKTGLKYLGKTEKDPYKYKGSGLHWLRHLKKHGSDLTTVILRECHSENEVKIWGMHYSEKWNVVESQEWANLKEERGDGGRASDKLYKTWSEKLTGLTWEERWGSEVAAAAKLKMTGRTLSDDTKKNMSRAKTGKGLGTDHSRFNGYFYITPWGEFASACAAASAFPGKPINECTIRVWCIQNNTKPLTRHTISRNTYFSQEHQGLTFREMGFGYEKR